MPSSNSNRTEPSPSRRWVEEASAGTLEHFPLEAVEDLVGGPPEEEEAAAMKGGAARGPAGGGGGVPDWVRQAYIEKKVEMAAAAAAEKAATAGGADGAAPR